MSDSSTDTGQGTGMYWDRKGTRAGVSVALSGLSSPCWGWDKGVQWWDHSC